MDIIWTIVLDFSRAFSILFIAMDPVSLIPVFLALTHKESLAAKRKIALRSCMAALAVGLLFLFAGKYIFDLLGIYMADFRIGGGLLLVTISIYDMINHGQSKKPDSSSSAVVPLGVPLITGPAVLTTLIFLFDNHGYPITIVSFCLNVLIVYISFYYSQWILKIFGSEGIRGFAKLISILLSAYGVMMIRRGIMEILKSSS
ncbi:MAG: MarC family protein [Spirochaetia bacterium]|nr:MarC family protein [Spirochaetia bacterium]